MSTYRTKLIQIGNSRWIRIPKALISQADLERGVEIAMEGNALIICSAKRPREGWAEQFKAIAERGDDRLLGRNDPHRMGPNRMDVVVHRFEVYSLG